MPSWLTDDTIRLLWQGVQLTLWLTLITSLLAFGLGVVVGILRLSPKLTVQQLARVYVAIFRNVPALVQIIFWAFAVPNLFSSDWRQMIFFDNWFVNEIGRITTLTIPYYALAAMLALSLNSSAYIAELFRAGVGTIERQQLDTARTLGATQAEVLRRLIIPQGVRAAFPTISTRLIHNMKNTALASFVAVPEFFNITQGIISKTFNAVALLTLAAIVYLVLSVLYSLLLIQIDRYLNREPSFTIRNSQFTIHNS